MDTKKDFDKYAAKVFGKDYNEKHFKSVGLSAPKPKQPVVKPDEDKRPLPFDVFVYDKNKNIIHDTEWTDSSLPDIDTTSPSVIKNEHYKKAKQLNKKPKQLIKQDSAESVIKRKRSKLNKQVISLDSEIGEDHITLEEPSCRPKEVGDPLPNYERDEYDTTDSEADLMYFCVDHFKMCKSRIDKHRHRHCQIDKIGGSGTPSLASSLSSRTESSLSSSLSLGRMTHHVFDTKTLEKLNSYAGVMIQDREAIKQHLAVKKNEIKEEFYTYMEDIVAKILTLKTKLLERLDEFHKEKLADVTKQTGRSHKLRHEGRQVWQTLQLPSTFNDLEKYKEIIETAKEKSKVLEEIGRRTYDSFTNVSYGFRPTEETNKILNIQSMGHIAICPDTPLLPPFLSIRDQDMDSEEFENTKPGLEMLACVEGDEANNLHHCGFTGCAYVTTELLLFTDWNNGLLKMYNEFGVLTDKLDLGASPWDIIQVCDGQAAVTVPNMQTVFFVECDTHLRSVGSFKTDCECFGISKMHDNYILTCDPWCNSPSVRVFTAQGLMVSCIQYNEMGRNIFKCPLHVCVDYFNTVMYVSDASADCVHALTLSGEVKFTYENIELRYPTGVMTDRNNYLYVCGKETANIHRVCNNGTSVHVIVREKEGLCSPRAISIHPDGEYMLITDLEGENANGYIRRRMQ